MQMGSSSTAHALEAGSSQDGRSGEDASGETEAAWKDGGGPDVEELGRRYWRPERLGSARTRDWSPCPWVGVH